jgi:colicin import membrane protein
VGGRIELVRNPLPALRVKNTIPLVLRTIAYLSFRSALLGCGRGCGSRIFHYNPRPQFFYFPSDRRGNPVAQAQHDLQLKVWKELAISKQVLMRTAAEALKLDPDCSQEELKAALDSALKKVAAADASVVQAQDQARKSIAAMEAKLAASEKAKATAETALADLQAKQERATQQMATDRTVTAKEFQKLKDTIAEKDKALKAINAALADTPENVIKKLKALRKEKQDEADARRQVEASLATLRKEKREQDQQLKDVLELVKQYRDLHASAVKLHEQLKPLVKDEKELEAVPELNTKLLEAIEQPKENGKKKDKDKE